MEPVDFYRIDGFNRDFHKIKVEEETNSGHGEAWRSRECCPREARTHTGANDQQSS